MAKQIYSRKFVQARFDMTFRSLGLPVGETWTKQPNGTHRANVGVYFLDYAPIYGGYCIRRMASEGGAEATPFGSMRYNGATFCAMLGAMMDLDFVREQRARDGKKPGER